MTGKICLQLDSSINTTFTGKVFKKKKKKNVL